MELDGKYGFLCGEGLDMISFGAFVMCGTQLAEHAAKICPIISQVSGSEITAKLCDNHKGRFGYKISIDHSLIFSSPN